MCLKISNDNTEFRFVVTFNLVLNPSLFVSILSINVRIFIFEYSKFHLLDSLPIVEFPLEGSIHLVEEGRMFYRILEIKLAKSSLPASFRLLNQTHSV